MVVGDDELFGFTVICHRSHFKLCRTYDLAAGTVAGAPLPPPLGSCHNHFYFYAAVRQTEHFVPALHESVSGRDHGVGLARVLPDA